MNYAVHRCLERNTLREVLVVCPADRPPSPRQYIQSNFERWATNEDCKEKVSNTREKCSKGL